MKLEVMAGRNTQVEEGQNHREGDYPYDRKGPKKFAGGRGRARVCSVRHAAEEKHTAPQTLAVLCVLGDLGGERVNQS